MDGDTPEKLKEQSVSASSRLYVQYGCGLSAPPTWWNFDASPTLRISRIPLIGSTLTRSGPRFPDNVRFGNVVKGLPIRDGACTAVYCSHVLEHLSLEECRIVLRETFRLLMPGGRFRFVLPDLRAGVMHYVESTDPRAAVQFIETSGMGVRSRPRGLGGFVRSWLGNSHHLWLWDYPAMEIELHEAGFTSVRRAEHGDCDDPRFGEVESKQRWTGALGVECFRPNP